MTRFGYTLMTEQSGPRELVRYAAGAEQCGFDFEVSSDHYFPWLDEQGHAPYAWSVLGAVAQVTERVELMTYVTCPTVRYHPVIVAQKAATLQLLADGRFTLGLGSGERLNEHVVGEGWPGVDTRQRMLTEAIEIIRRLHEGELLTFSGEYFEVDSARVWDLPPDGVDLAVAVSGPKSIEHFAPLADHLIAVEPNPDFVPTWNQVDGASQIPDAARAIGQIPICWDPSREAAIDRAHEQFRWFGGGWAVNADLPTTASSRAPRSSSPRTMSPSRLPADLTWTRSRSRCAPSWTPVSPTSRLSRSATRGRAGSWRRPPLRCWTSCARSSRYAVRNCPVGRLASATRPVCRP